VAYGSKKAKPSESVLGLSQVYPGVKHNQLEISPSICLVWPVFCHWFVLSVLDCWNFRSQELLLPGAKMELWLPGSWRSLEKQMATVDSARWRWRQQHKTELDGDSGLWPIFHWEQQGLGWVSSWSKPGLSRFLA